MAGAYSRDQESRTAWLSRGFEVLAAQVLAQPNSVHFDVLVVGSGYGGAIAAAALAGAALGAQPIRVGVLERGKEYLPGSFPVGLRELPRHIRRDSNKEGLFDIRLSAEVNTVVANGVGGGSLINAGVMQKPADSVFATGWPAALGTAAARDPYYDEVRALLGAFHDGASNTIERQFPTAWPQKTEALKALEPHRFKLAELTIAMTDTNSSGNVALKKCTRCGDCATGCNFGAKNSLDVNLLVLAHDNGAEIYSGATVLEVVKEPAGTWLVRCVHTNAKLRAREETSKDRVTEVRATNVVLAAGALGSTEILMRSKGLTLSPKLGQRCSTNGDMLVVDYDTKQKVETVADEAIKPSARAIGPTITGIVDLRGTADDVVIEEMSVPGGLRRAFTELFATVNTLHSLGEYDWSKHDDGFSYDDIYAAPAKRIEYSALYAVMGNDGAAGTIELVDGATLTTHDDGVARMRWPAIGAHPALPDSPLFETQVAALRTLIKNAGIGGRLIPNPVWKLLPKGMEWLLEDKKGPLTTVHPLGGCAMADSWTDGVVDDRGRVFASSTPGDFHPGLAVLDGAMIPTALGTNPALTIAAVALRASRLLAQSWGYKLPAAMAAPAATSTRPVFRITDEAFTPAPTEVEVIERLVGPVRFRTPGKSAVTRIVELTLAFKPKPVNELSTPPPPGTKPELVVNDHALAPIKSRIRIYDEVVWRGMEKRWTRADRFERELEAISLYSAPLTGTLRVFERQKTRALLRRIPRAIGAYLANRGLRDAYQADPKIDGGPGWLARIKSGGALASRSGEIRAFVYDLSIGTPDAGAVFSLTDSKIRGYKRLTYGRRANPWRQLMEVELDQFPGLQTSADERVLKLDTRFLVRIGVPLFRITSQTDGVTALAELGTFAGYFLRQLLGLHIWSFRAPDKENPVRVPNRLPRTHQADLPIADQFTIPLAPEIPAGEEEPVPGEVIVTRFAQAAPDPAKRPLLMLHGYSASGTTFAHHALPDSFARYFHQNGWDVWIAELRTSPAHELKPGRKKRSAEHPWSFEQIARTDLPAVLDHIQLATMAGCAKKKIDVIAHCMGTVVFGMAALDTKHPTNVPNQVERVAFTQVGPLVVFSPANIFRAYALRYFVEFLPDSYRFRPEGEPTLADDLWDRLLATLPYPIEEFDIENPPKPSANTSWTRTRHRMDALYGRDFNLVNIEDHVLDHIDDHFGPLSLRTVAQTLHFVRYSMITSFEGDNDFVSRENLRTRWPFPTLSLHGAENGLAHPATVDRMRAVYADAGRRYLPPLLIADAGHQDALIGTKRQETCEKIKDFLTSAVLPPETPASTAMVAYPPWIGPILTEERPSPTAPPVLVLRVGAAPTHHKPEGVVMLRVSLDGDRVVRPDDPTQPWTLAYVLEHAAYYKSAKLTDRRWDAFDAPLPELMPGFPPAGQALLVLIVYSESPELDPGRTLAYYRQGVGPGGTPMLVEFSPTARGFERSTVVTYANFLLAARAALTALVAQPPRTEARVPARERAGHPVLLAARDARALELPIPLVKGLPEPPATTGLIFGTNTLAATLDSVDTSTGTAIVEAIEHDRNLHEGVVPYDSPAAAPTSPSAAGTTFALLSCQYPAGFVDDTVAYASYRRLLGRLEAAAGAAPRFLVLTGDQVYVDPTAGLYDPSALDARYHVPYENWLRQHAVRHALRRVPSFMLLDDHEIDDNWEPLPAASNEAFGNKSRLNDAKAAYGKYQRGKDASLSFDFRFDGFPFYLLDTRTTRSPRSVGTLGAAELFDAAAFTAFKNWLLAAGPGPKFVVSPALLLPRLRRTAQHGGGLSHDNVGALHSDGWDGYPRTLAAVLALIAEETIEHVVFLSGDAHRACVTELTLRNTAGGVVIRAHSIHTTAAYAPFPFANGVAEDFMAKETLSFTHTGHSYECRVDATLPAVPDGATILRPWRDGLGAWKLDYEYAAGGTQTLTL